MSDMRDILERELRQHAAALRGLARDLVGAGDADDVMQETALQALRTPPARAGALGGWLAGIVRHVASRHRRTEARRLRREQIAARELVAEDAPPDDGDVLRLLTDAVLALPQPYRAAVFARYLKDLGPAQIAAQTGEPLGTIKTRLVRGLALLRERFDARERERGGDWRAAFAGAFGLERMTAATTATAGVFVMTATMKWALGAVTAAIVVVSTFALAPLGSSASGPAPAASGNPVLAQATVPGSAPHAATQEPPAVRADTVRTPAEPAAVPAPADAAACIVRGRCVDDAGAPRGGVHARLDGRGDIRERMATWKKQHGEPAELDQRTETGADGAFEFRLSSQPPFSFDLELEGRGIATWRCFWNELAAGTTDLGEVVLVRGTLLRGRVVDADGAPVSNVNVDIERVAQDGGDRGPVQHSTGWAKKDGSFRMQAALIAGDYKLEISGQKIERPTTIALTGEPEQSVDVVLKRPTDADAIRGVVVDEEGAPVRGATVAPMLNGSFRNTSTDAEGRFRVLRRTGMPDRVGLWVIADGYEVPLVREAFAWGRTDLRFVATKGKGLAVQVVRASDGAPIEDFVLRVAPFGGGSSFDLRPHEPPHANGRVAVSGVRYGRHHVIVAPRDATLAIGVVPIEVTASGAPPVTVRLGATTERTVRVQRSDGSTVCDASVQLVDPLGEPLAERTNVRAPREWQGYSGPIALVLAAAVTDARGEARLLAPGDRALGLRLPGPAHVPHTVPSAIFPDDGPLVVTVQTGATLRGTIGPEAAFAEIRRLARIDATEPPTSGAWPWIQLWRDAAGARERFPDLRTRCSLAKDGTFELIGVPPGRWRIVVQCKVANDRGGGRYLEEDGGFVDLAAGEVVSRTIDLGTMLPGELEGVVLHNGAPLAGAPVQLRMGLADHPDGHPYHVEDVTTDTAGRFRARIRAGEYELVWMPVREMGSWVTVQVVAAERGRVEVGKRTEQTFSLATGLVLVLLLDPSGKPARNVVLQCRDAGDVERFLFAPTDAEGRTKTECNIAPFTMFVLPERLQDPTAAQAHRQARLGQQDPFADVRLTVGRFMPRAGETVTVELRLPPEWEQ